MNNNQRNIKVLSFCLLIVSLILISFNLTTSVYAVPPTISSPDDITFNEGDIGKKISWTAYSENPFFYEVYQDDVLVELGYWISNYPITHSISHLKVGDYEFVVQVFDDFFESTNDTVLVHVRDFAAPTIYTSPEDKIVELNSTEEYIEWSAIDPYPASFELKRNNIVVDSGAWEGEVRFQFLVDATELGTFTYCLSLTDESNNTASDCVIVEVVETTKTRSGSIIIPIIAIITLLSIARLVKRRVK
jgi:hypothetical protein